MMKRSRSRGWATSAGRSAWVIALCAAGIAGLQGCSKKKPPPPPPPPPPAPVVQEAPKVSFDTISQDMHADARVQFAPGLALEDADLAKSIVKLCDAIARGDAGAMSSVLSKPGRQVIQETQDRDEFEGMTKDIEAVRVVFVGKNDETSGFKMSLDDISKAFGGKADDVATADMKVPPEVARKAGALWGAAMAGSKDFDIKMFEPPMTADKLQQIRDAWEQFRNDPAHAAVVEEIKNLLQAATAVPGLKDAEYMVLVAIQEPKGVELTGWGAEKAFGEWQFTNAATTPKQLARASDWDNIGLAGFASGGSGPVVAPKKSDDKKAGEKEEEGKEKEPDEKRPPNEKRTPHGPIKIPGSG